MKPLQFSIDRQDDSCGKWGRYYWIVGLPDGRELSVYADHVELHSGVLCFVSHATDTRPETTTLALPAGAWAHYYGASVIDGSPVSIERLAAPQDVKAD